MSIQSQLNQQFEAQIVTKKRQQYKWSLRAGWRDHGYCNLYGTCHLYVIRTGNVKIRKNEISSLYNEKNVFGYNTQEKETAVKSIKMVYKNGYSDHFVATIWQRHSYCSVRNYLKLPTAVVLNMLHRTFSPCFSGHLSAVAWFITQFLKVYYCHLHPCVYVNQGCKKKKNKQTLIQSRIGNLLKCCL